LNGFLCFFYLRLWLLLLFRLELLKFRVFILSNLVKLERMLRLFIGTNKLNKFIRLKSVQVEVKSGILNELTAAHCLNEHIDAIDILVSLINPLTHSIPVLNQKGETDVSILSIHFNVLLIPI